MKDEEEGRGEEREGGKEGEGEGGREGERRRGREGRREKEREGGRERKIALCHHCNVVKLLCVSLADTSTHIPLLLSSRLELPRPHAFPPSSY